MGDYLTWGLIGMIVVLGLTIYCGLGITLGAGDYDNKDLNAPGIWSFYGISLFFYIIAAVLSIGFGYYGVGTFMMTLSLFSDYILDLIAGEDTITVAGYTGGYTGIKYTSFISKTIMLTIMAYLAGISGSESDNFGAKYGSRFIQKSDASRSLFGERVRDQGLAFKNQFKR